MYIYIVKAMYMQEPYFLKRISSTIFTKAQAANYLKYYYLCAIFRQNWLLIPKSWQQIITKT